MYGLKKTTMKVENNHTRTQVSYANAAEDAGKVKVDVNKVYDALPKKINKKSPLNGFIGIHPD